MTGTEDAVGDSRVRALEAADGLFASPSTDPGFEPDSPEAARIAIERFEELLGGLPGVVTEVVAGARAGARNLSGDPLQGLSEIVQNADDAGATEVRFRLLEGVLLIAHNGRGLVLRDVLALALPWLTTKRADASATGRFGIGLMTLHTLTHTLEVFSGHYALRLGDPAISQIEPGHLPNDFAAPGYTVFRLPLRRNVSQRRDPARVVREMG
jgi:hypothetical protein